MTHPEIITTIDLTDPLIGGPRGIEYEQGNIGNYFPGFEKISKAGAVIGLSFLSTILPFGENNLVSARPVCIVKDFGTGECLKYIELPDNTSPSPSPSPTPGPTPLPKPVDTDPDKDGLNFSVDNCDNVSNSDQANFDSDGDGDVCDSDIDNDGISNDLDVNNYSVDNDNDGLHDAFDPDATNNDIDGDEFLDGDTTELEDKSGDGTQDLFQSRIDIDVDGYSVETGDIDETNTCVPSADATNCDQDEDGLTNTEELKKGTNPLAVDTDSDGINDNEDKEPLSKSGVLVDKFGVELLSTTTSESVTTSTDIDEGDTTSSTIETVIASNNSDKNNILLPIGLITGALGLGGIFVARRRQRNQEDSTVGFSGNDTSTVSGN